MHAIDQIWRARAATGNDLISHNHLSDLDSFSEIAFSRCSVRQGDSVYRCGDKFDSLYVIRSGFFKATDLNVVGREQVTGFFMRGDLFGLEGIGSGCYLSRVTALEDSEIVVLPFARLEWMSQDDVARQRQLRAVLSREIGRSHGLVLLLGKMNAEARLAAFISSLAIRLARRGYSGTDIQLRMKREEIGSYLGLKVETVSRAFTKFHKDGVLQVDGRHIKIADMDGLRRLFESS